MKRQFQILIAIAFVLMGTAAIAQPTDIQANLTIGGDSDERIRGMAVGPADQIYQVGFTNSTSVSSGGGSTSLVGISQAGFLTLIDSTNSTAGRAVLSNAIAEDVAVASNGDIYVVGEITGASDLVPGGGFANTPPNTSNAFVWKLDDGLNTIWVKTFPTASAEANASTIDIDDNDNLYIVGEFSGTIDMDINGTSASASGQQYTSTAQEDLYILKTDSAANFIKYQVVTGSGNDIVTDSDLSVSANRFAITGFGTSSSMNFSGNTISNFTLAPRKNFAAMYDTALTIQFTTNLYYASSNSQPVNQSIAIDDNDGSFALCGINDNSFLQIRVNDSPTGQTLGSGGFVLKHNADGSYAWQQTFGGSGTRLLSVDFDDSSNVYFSGWVPGAVQIGQDAAFNTVSLNATGNSIVGSGVRSAGFGMYDKYGRAVWGEIIGDNPSAADFRASNIVVTDNNHIAISGEYNSGFNAYNLISISAGGGGIDIFNMLLNYDAPCIAAAMATPMPDTAICAGGNFSFTPDLENTTGTTTYQWFDADTFNPVAGQTSASFDLTNATTDDAGDYFLEVDNGCGLSVLGYDSLTISVNDTTIVALLDSTGGCLGNDGHIRPSTLVTAPATYEWFKDGTLIATQTDEPALAIPNFSAADEGEYVVTVTDACGTDNDTTILSSDKSIFIAQDFPDVFYVCTSANLITVFSTMDTLINVAGTVNGNTQFSNSDWTFPSYGFQVFNNPNQLGNQFRVVLTGTCDTVLTNPATLSTGTNFPVIDTQPTDSTVNVGGTASFTVEASAANSFAYQWLKDGVALTNGGNISGATSATLTISGAATADEGDYSVEVTGGCTDATTTSDAATLTVSGISGRPALSAQGIRIYPNPTDGELNIAFDNTTENLTAVLTDVSGRQVQVWRSLRTTAGTTNTLSLEGVASGLYILELRGEDFRAQQRVAVR